MIENMEIINPLLQHIVFTSMIVMGICSLFMGLQIFNMGRDRLANRKGLALCLCSFAWSVGYGWVLISINETMVYAARFLGMFGVYMWISMVLSYIMEMGVARNRKMQSTVAMMIMVTISLMIVIQACRKNDITIMAAPFGVTFVMNNSIHKIIRYAYIGIVFIFTLIVLIQWYFSRKLKRNKRAGLIFLLALFLFPVGAILDVVLPFFGKPVFPSSAYTNFLATCIIYYVTKENNSFTISMKNVSEYITESVQTPFFVLNYDCEVILMNKSAYNFLGQTAKRSSFKTCDYYFQNEEIVLSEELQRRINAHEKDFSIQGECINNHAICNMQFSIVYDRYNQCLCVIMLVNDITNEYATIKKLRASQHAEERANHAKTIFLANMSHEIRTPINTILGMDEMIIRETKEPLIREYAINIQNSGKLLLALISDVLDFSRIEAGKMEITSDEYEVSSMLNDIVNMATVKTEAKGLRFNVEADERIPHLLYGDEMRIRQVITNILNNAVKYTPKGEVTLHIGWKLVAPSRMDMYIDVSDTGVGIRKEDMDKIFLSFERLDVGKNKSIEGSGLGLSITGRLLELMHGKMEIESEYGKGSTFHITIPQKIIDYEPIGDFKAMYERSIQMRKNYQETFIAPDAKALIVDDNDMNLAVAKGFLKKTQIQIKTAMSGQECLDILLKEKFDIIFMDHMMPNMDGIETLKHIQEEYGDIYENVPIIALTANAISGAKEMYLSKGFSDYLAKPIEADKIESILLKYLPKEFIKIL